MCIVQITANPQTALCFQVLSNCERNYTRLAATFEDGTSKDGLVVIDSRHDATL